MANENPYGDVSYADPGFQGDGVKRYPIDSAEHVRAALSYWGRPSDRSHYSAQQQHKIGVAIHAAARKFGIDKYENAGRVAAKL